MKIKETLKGFNINIDDIEPCDFEIAIKDLCKNLALALDKQRYEIVLNKNILDIKDTFTNFHSYMGLKLSFESFEKDISFIVRPSFELSYDELLKENKKQKEVLANAIAFYENNKQECVIGRTGEGKLRRDYYLPAHLSKTLIDILKRGK